MKNITRIGAIAALTAFALSGAAHAQVQTQSTTDLNMRSGPGPQFEVVGVIPEGGSVSLEGCVESGKWCRVTADGKQGWAYSDYLTASVGGNATVVTNMPADQRPVVSYDGTPAGAAGGAVIGALVGGPVGAAIGGAIGAGIGANNPPPEPVRTYVRENRVDPVYLDGEVVVGAGIPANVELRQIPDYQYRYVYVNGVPVLVEPESRRIVYVYR